MDRGCLFALLLVACAPTKNDARERTAVPSSFEERLAADPSWRPGDSEPARRELTRYEDPWPDEAAAVPIPLRVEVRNRCAEPATFVVGPQQETPPADAPTNEVGPGEAISTHIAGNELLWLRDADGRYTMHAPPDNLIVFLGDHACDRIWHGR